METAWGNLAVIPQYSQAGSFHSGCCLSQSGPMASSQGPRQLWSASLFPGGFLQTSLLAGMPYGLKKVQGTDILQAERQSQGRLTRPDHTHVDLAADSQPLYDNPVRDEILYCLSERKSCPAAQAEAHQLVLLVHSECQSTASSFHLRHQCARRP